MRHFTPHHQVFRGRSVGVDADHTGPDPDAAEDKPAAENAHSIAHHRNPHTSLYQVTELTKTSQSKRAYASGRGLLFLGLNFDDCALRNPNAG